MKLEVFEATGNTPDPIISGIVPVIEKHWRSAIMNTIPGGGGSRTYRVSTPSAVDSAVNSGHQVVYVGIRGSYDDGIPNTKPQFIRHLGFTIYDIKGKTLGWFEGDPVGGLNHLVQVVDYPKNEEKGEQPQ